jgi:hypothetical protein
MPNLLAIAVAFIDRAVPASDSRRRELRILLSGYERSLATSDVTPRMREDATLIRSTLSGR